MILFAVLLMCLLEVTLCAEFAGAAVNSIKDLYDIKTIKQMSLEDLQWKETSRTVLKNGTLRIEGTFVSGTWETISNDDLANGLMGNTKMVNLVHPIKLFIPPGYPNIPTVGYGAVVALQGSASYDTKVNHEKIFAKPAIQAGIPILIHSTFDSLWLNRGFAGSNELMSASVKLMMMKDVPTIENLRLCLIYAYVLEDLTAITLMQRLLEVEGGHMNVGVIAQGGSKQGWANWLLGVVDDRVKVSVPINMQLQDFITGIGRYETDWGCQNVVGCGDGFSAMDRLAGLEWMLSSEAGRDFYRVYGVSNQQDLLFPEFYVVASDVTSPGHHDCQFPLGADSVFLNGLIKPWRGFRLTDAAPEDDAYWTSKADPKFILMWQAALKKLIQPQTIEWTKVIGVTMEPVFPAGLKVSATVTHNNPNPIVKLWYAPSANRMWNDEEQSNSWRSALMTMENGAWSKTFADIPLNKMWAYYVEVEDVGEDGLTRIDASAVEFFNDNVFPQLQCHP